MRKLIMRDPEFSPGSEHTAHALMTNNTPKAWTYSTELYLVKDGTTYTSSGTITFSLAAGASRTIDFPIIMPDIEGTYKVYLDIYVAAELIAAYQATEDVEIVAMPEITGVTGEVICDLLPGVTLELLQGDMLIDSTISDETSHYALPVPAPGFYDVVASKAGFKSERQSINIEPGQPYELNFRGETGLIPYLGPHGDLENYQYMIECYNHWQEPPSPECALSEEKAGEVVWDYTYPIGYVSLVIEVYDVDGNPLESTEASRISFILRQDSEEIPWLRWSYAGDGKFILRHPESGTYDVIVRKEGFKDGAQANIELVARTPDQSAQEYIEATALQFYLEPAKPTLAIDRFFALTIPYTADYGDFEIHCHVKNTGDGVGIGQINLVGVMNIRAGYTKEINKVYEFTLAPGEVYDCIYIDSTYRLKNVWVKAIGDWGEETPVLEFKAGYYSDDTELVATKIGSNYAILRYAHSSAEDSWYFRCRTDGEQEVEYPKIKLSNHDWTTIYHAILGLLSGRTYSAYAENADRKYITFTTL